MEKARVAVVHDWLVTAGGAERVLENILDCFPKADIYCIVDFLPKHQRRFLSNKKVTTSFIQRLPFAKSKYRSYLPLMPLAVEQFNLSDYDLVISSSHAVAKGVLTGPDQLHICLCYSPMRYAWDLQFQYLSQANLQKGLKSLFVRIILHKLRIWDLRTSVNVDYFIAISRFIQRRIRKAYNRHSHVIYPPVATDEILMIGKKKDSYLTVSRMVPYKNVPLIVEAFSKMPEKKLIVIGDGPDFEKCKKIATSNIMLTGWKDRDYVISKMQEAKAFVFAAEEDFGITPIEAQACGTPVIAYGKGGSVETIAGGDTNNATGVFFYEQSVTSIVEAVYKFEELDIKIDPEHCRLNASRFSANIFQENFNSHVNKLWKIHQNRI